MAVWLNLADLRLGLTGPVVPREQVQALQQLSSLHEQARHTLAEAQVQAEAMLAEAEAHVQTVQREAQQAGYAEGLAQALNAWHQQAAALRQEAARQHARQREQLASLVVQATAQLIGGDCAPAFFQQALQALDALAERASSLRVHVHPDDLPLAQAALAEWAPRWRDGTHLKWLCDPDLPRSSCICESEVGLINASLSQHLESLRQAVQASWAVLEGDPQAPHPADCEDGADPDTSLGDGGSEVPDEGEGEDEDDYGDDFGDGPAYEDDDEEDDLATHPADASEADPLWRHETWADEAQDEAAARPARAS